MTHRRKQARVRVVTVIKTWLCHSRHVDPLPWAIYVITQQGDIWCFERKDTNQ
jgi:hypothetical protein